LHNDNTPPHISFFARRIFGLKQYGSRPHTPYFYQFHRLKVKLKGRHFDTIEVIAGGAEHSHRTRLPGFIYKMAEALGKVHTHGKERLRG
jgi:hypothetical protein